MSTMQTVANVLDSEGNIIDGYFYADTDVKYVLEQSIERADEELEDYDTIEVASTYDEDEIIGAYHRYNGEMWYDEEFGE